MFNSPQDIPYFPHLLTYEFILVMAEETHSSHTDSAYAT